MAPVKLLVFVGTEGIYHDHEGQGQFLTDLLNQDAQIETDFSRDYEVMANGLAAYDATLFFTDVGHFSQVQEQGLLHFIERGGGFFGLHTADASFRDNTGYHQMLNGFSMVTARTWISPSPSPTPTIPLPPASKTLP